AAAAVYAPARTAAIGLGTRAAGDAASPAVDAARISDGRAAVTAETATWMDSDRSTGSAVTPRGSAAIAASATGAAGASGTASRSGRAGRPAIAASIRLSEGRRGEGQAKKNRGAK